MKIFATLIGLILSLIKFIFKIIFYPITALIDFKPDYFFQFNYGNRFCWIDLKFQGNAQSISSSELASCYLQYLLKVLNVMPKKSVPLVVDCVEAGLKNGSDYMQITEKIFGEVLLKSLNEMQRSLVATVDFPGAVSSSQKETTIRWKHFFKIDKLPSQKIHFNFESSPTDILLPLSCGLFYGYVIENMNPLEKERFKGAIENLIGEVRKNDVQSLGSYMKLSKFARQLV